MTAYVTLETVKKEETDTRLDRWVKRRLPISQSQVEKFLRSGQIRVDGKRCKANFRVTTGMEVRLPPVSKEVMGLKPEKKPVSERVSQEDQDFIRNMIIYQDDDLIAFNKPNGLAVQGGSGQKQYIDRLLPALVDKKTGYIPRLVHRLDKATSGVLVVARHPAAAAHLGHLFKSRDMDKIYWAITIGLPNPAEGQLRSWMKRGEGRDKEKMVTGKHGDRDARHAITEYVTVSTAGQRAAWVALKPLTGRTHQLRFHMAELDTAILGDFKYTTKREVPTGLAHGLHLHARAISIPRKKGPPLTIIAPLSSVMKQTFSALGFQEREAGKTPFTIFEDDALRF